MKQISLALLAVSLVVFSSCKKESTTSSGGGENTFKIDGKTYEATKVFYIESDNIIKAQRVKSGTGLNEVQAISITFSDAKLPTTGGSFEIVSDPYSPGNTANNNQVSILASTFPYDFGSYVDDNTFKPLLSPVQHVTVTINSSKKINVQFTNIAVKDINGKATTISGNITQP